MKRIAVIGLGNIAKRHRRNLKILYPGAHVWALSASGRVPDHTIEDCDHLVQDIESLIAAEIEFAIVASPATRHTLHALPLIHACIPVLIEKPVATELPDIESLINAADKHKTPVAVGYCLRYLPSAQKMHQLLVARKAGQLYNATVEVGQYLPDWRPDTDYRSSVSARADLGGGALFELSHELDYARWLLGELEIQAAILRRSDTLKLDVEDSTDLLATTPQKAVVSIHLDFLQRTAYRYCRFTGSEGALAWDLIKNSIVFSDAQGTHTVYAEPEWDKNKMYLEMILDFTRMIRGEEHRCVLLEDAGKTIALIHQIRQKASPGDLPQ